MSHIARKGVVIYMDCIIRMQIDHAGRQYIERRTVS